MSQTLVSPPLAGRTVLVVEDEYFQVEDMAQALMLAGARLVGPCPTVPAALDLLRTEPQLDAAVLDINLRGQEVFPLADALRERGVPIIFATGYDRGMLPQEHQAAMLLEKPFRVERLIDALTYLCRAGPAGA